MQACVPLDLKKRVGNVGFGRYTLMLGAKQLTLVPKQCPTPDHCTGKAIFQGMSADFVQAQ